MGGGELIIGILRYNPLSVEHTQLHYLDWKKYQKGKRELNKNNIEDTREGLLSGYMSTTLTHLVLLDILIMRQYFV